MKVRYDADSDILYISIKDDDVEDMDELEKTSLWSIKRMER